MPEDTTPEDPPNPEAPETQLAILTGFTPVPRQRDRSDGWKPEIQRAFIEALADTGSVRAACRVIGRSDNGAYQLRRHPEGAEFAAAWDAALEHGIRRLEDALMERALNGVEVPVFAWGELVGKRTVYNDRLGMFMLRNRLPARYCTEGARGLNAIGKMDLERAKKEWQAERDREEQEAEQAADSFIDDIADMHVMWWSHLGPRTRAAYREFRRIEEEEGRRWLEELDDPEAAIEAAEAEYAEVFANDGRSKAKLLGEACGIGDDRTCPEPDEAAGPELNAEGRKPASADSETSNRPCPTPEGESKDSTEAKSQPPPRQPAPRRWNPAHGPPPWAQPWKP